MSAKSRPRDADARRNAGDKNRASANTLRVSPEAREDLQEIWDYLGPVSVDAADKTIEAIGATFSSLLDFPLMGRARPELLPDIRSFVVEKYVIFYAVDGDFVIIARVLHGARDLDAIFAPSPMERN